MYSDFAKREDTPRDKLLQEALKSAQDIPQAHENWWNKAKPEEISAYYESIVSEEFWKKATIPQLAVLLDNRADRDATDKNGKTALMYASQYCLSPEVVRWFLQFEPDVNVKDKNGNSAQDYALKNPVLAGCADIIAALQFENLLCNGFWKNATMANVADELKQGKDINMHNDSNETPLMLACHFCSNPQVIEFLLKSGADLNAQADLRFNTALMCACRWNNIGVVKLLVQNGANVNYAAIRGYTALMAAAEYNSDAEVIRYLIANGADVIARDMYKNTARTYLKRNKALAKDKTLDAFLRKLEWKARWNNFVQKLWK